MLLSLLSAPNFEEELIMRYYGLTINTSAEKLEKNSIVRLKDYDYDNTICALNHYMYKNLTNGVSFLAYRYDGNDGLHAVFSHDESKLNLSDAYGHLLAILNGTFHVKRMKEEFFEITMGQFYDCLLEGKRRGNAKGYFNIVDNSNLRIYDDYYKDSIKNLKYSFDEKIVTSGGMDESAMYDDDFLQELSNIESHKNSVEFKGNMVHYVISSRSLEAAGDMVDALVGKLYDAGRLSTRRALFIKEIHPDVHVGNSHLEDLIENISGGTVVIDLTEKFGASATDYNMASKYIENLVKEYRKDCLFIFTYNVDSPGYSYNLIPKLNKYVLPVMLREGSGDRAAAVIYMKKLIGSSEYAKYANQAKEFMKRIPGDKFSQTDVLMAYEKFEPWCINKNIFKAYDYDISDEFILDRDENEEAAYDKLEAMIGLNIVKDQIKNIIATDIVEKERKNRIGTSYKTGSMHMIFSGNPGTAKTTVAKLFAGITKEKGILKSGAFVEKAGMDLEPSGLVSAAYKVRKAFEAAKGGVLFIDEAYSLKSDDAITALIQEMENRREEVIVILAGYKERMKGFMERNEGLKSRIPYWIDFPDYDANELTEIFKLMLKERGFSATEEAIKEAHYIFDKIRYIDDFGNGRYVRNLIERAIKNQSIRLINAKGNTENIAQDEMLLITRDDICGLEEGLQKEREAGTALKELEEMIGLSSVKSVIKKAIANFKLNKLCMDRGIHRDKASLHMVFTGNPGTAKTTVARLFAEILKDEKVLPTGNFVEAGRADLISGHVGGTAPLVTKKFKEARGGVLFIDEAYSLCDNHRGSYGDEAINTIVQEMENHREDVIVVFAGYPDEMQQFLDRNPGLTSRIAFRVNFEDYSVDELMDISRLMLSRKDMSITDAAMDKLKLGYEAASKNSDYGNGRYVRKVLEEAQMNLAQRLMAMDESELTTELLTTIEECDVPDMNVGDSKRKSPIGFCVA